MTQSLLPQRLKTFRRTLTHQHLDAMLVSKRENIAYLTNVRQNHPTHREALLFVTQKQACLYHSLFLKPPPAGYLESLAMDHQHPLSTVLANLFPTPTVLGIEGHDLYVNEYQKLLENSKLSLVATDLLLEKQRQIKDDAEIKLIRKACRITARVSRALPRYFKAGLTELELSILIERLLIDAGASSLAFPVIAAFGAHSALPHHVPGKTKLRPQDTILVDFGCVVDGYCSDLTRTYFLGSPPPLYHKIESVVKSAYAAAVNLLRTQFDVIELTQSPAVIPKSSYGQHESKTLTAGQLDQAARQVINLAGYAANFIHTTGHGLGLEIHESPSLALNNHTPLRPRMVITIEPGIYLPRQFGYRHENTLLLS